MKFDLALIIPCYNEETRLPNTFEKLKDFFVGKNSVVVFVDDGSLDKTLDTLEKFCRENSSWARVVRHEKNRGKGAAVKTGFAAVEAGVYGFTDADLSFGLKAIPEFLEKMSEADVVIASRKSKQETRYSFFRKVVSKSLLFLSRTLTGVRASDPQSGFKFFSARVVQEVFPQIAQERFAFDTECLLRIEKAGYRVAEIPLEFVHDGQSSVRASDGLRYLLDLLAISDTLPFSFRKFVLELVGLNLFLSLAVYGWVIRAGYFFSDDFTWLWFGQRIAADPHQIWTLKAGSFFSPVMNIFYGLMMKVFGPSAPVFFAADLLIHVSVAVGVGLLVWLLSRSRLAAFLAAALFVVSGGAYEPLVWIGANLHSMATLFVIFTLISYAGFLKTERQLLLVLSLLFQFLAYSTKEISIVIPILLVILLWSWKKIYKKFSKTWPHLVFWIFSALLAGAYVVLEIILQEGGDTFAANNYSIGASGLLRLPFALLDLFVPLRPFQDLFSPKFAAVVFVLTVVLVVLIIKKYWRLSGLPLFLVLSIVSLLPTTFFVTTNWWEPLASRYTYLPRAGAVSALAIILSYYIVHNRARRVINLVAIAIVVVSIFQIVFMLKIVASDYDYVYRSGRSLATAIKSLDKQNTETVYVYPERPFRENHAHVVGAMSVYAGVVEDQIVFLDYNEEVQLSLEKMLLYWYPKARQYELTSDQEIFKRFPLP